MRFKKFIRRFSAATSVFLLILCMAVPAFAAETYDGSTWVEVDLYSIKSYQTIAITMDLNGVTYALPSNGSWGAVAVTVNDQYLISDSIHIGWNIIFNGDDTFRLYQANSAKYLIHRSSNTPSFSLDSSYPSDWFVDNGYLAIWGDSLHYMVIRSTSWDDLASTTATKHGCSNLRFWMRLENKSYFDVITGSLSTILGWFGIMFSSLTASNGALSPVLPFFMIAVSVPVILLCVKVVKEFTWGS